ncbi:hypothetical protein BDZ45DRAFT_694218 [Acephala macrosclerotiorum]|nr:hypothetical protein BDZ45DRAFT_694218 [Acephala macrosclerotiorum]
MLIIKTHASYLVDCLSKHVWEWEKTNNYEDGEMEVVNRFLIEKIHDMIKESKSEERIKVLFWLVGVEQNQAAVHLTDEVSSKRDRRNTSRPTSIHNFHMLSATGCTQHFQI